MSDESIERKENAFSIRAHSAKKVNEALLKIPGGKLVVEVTEPFDGIVTNALAMGKYTKGNKSSDIKK
ncbi:hypothetical protein A2863_02175 [Candidatus Woesebacteria bacterium RIFCSPHIGHO2_01_FULL_38_9b]|uniref:Uncharacterized protein n=1 Tax=Candidatus Woesebacteria bacterium RIFCSPHIGHO2_01_FULL_38_9b TaxID=1802493 RepID=A0A1F7XZ21_9BACT|nr:MAG: hypothetical protein A2863_02175 [Candidatus Woesebacteria bacterium RIFCSPHIGHO2_01_FULL_38_9b]